MNALADKDGTKPRDDSALHVVVILISSTSYLQLLRVHC
jgi:hypothetical protein